MPAYPSPRPAALYPGMSIPLVNNAAVDSGITKTESFAVTQSGGFTGTTVMFTNTTNEDAQGEFAVTDADANYVPLSGCIVPTGTALAYNLSGGWLRFTFAVAPTSGSLIASR